MVFISIPGDISEPNTTFMMEDWPRVLGIISIPTSQGTRMLTALIGDQGQKQTEVPIPANRRWILHENTTGNNHIKSLWKWSWSLPVLPEDVPSFSVGAAIVFMFSFQSSAFWILSLHTARFFIWHCWGILPSLQAAWNLLADLLAKTTRSGELSPVKQRQLSSNLPNFCWLLICCRNPVVPLGLPWKSSHCYIFWGTQEPINSFCPCTCRSCDVGFLGLLRDSKSSFGNSAWAWAM